MTRHCGGVSHPELMVGAQPHAAKTSDQAKRFWEQLGVAARRM